MLTAGLCFGALSLVTLSFENTWATLVFFVIAATLIRFAV